MPRALQVIAPAILTLAACAVGVVLATSVASYGYDGVGTPAGSDVAAPPTPGVVLGRWLDEAARDAVTQSHDDHSNLARASSRPDDHRSARRSVG